MQSFFITLALFFIALSANTAVLAAPTRNLRPVGPSRLPANAYSGAAGSASGGGASFDDPSNSLLGGVGSVLNLGACKSFKLLFYTYFMLIFYLLKGNPGDGGSAASGLGLAGRTDRNAYTGVGGAANGGNLSGCPPATINALSG